MKLIKNKFISLKINNEAGFSLMLVFAAVLVLFTTFSFVKVGSLETIDPDLRRIGINIGPQASVNPLAENQTTNPNQADSEIGTPNQNLIIASNSISVDADSDIENEGDNPVYIE